MRQFSEAYAMAILCADRSTGVYDSYAANKVQYPVHKAVEKVLQKKVKASLEKSMKLDAEAWEAFCRFSKSYDPLSHPAALALAHQVRFDEPGSVILGGEFDSRKVEAYQKELESCINASQSLVDLIEAIGCMLPQNNSPDRGLKSG